jgi:hypothetical protein
MNGVMALNLSATRSKAHILITLPCLCCQFYTGHEMWPALYTEARFVCMRVRACKCVPCNDEPIYNSDNKPCGNNYYTGLEMWPALYTEARFVCMCACVRESVCHVTTSQYITQITNDVATIITLVLMFSIGTIIKFTKCLGLLNC